MKKGDRKEAAEKSEEKHARNKVQRSDNERDVRPTDNRQPEIMPLAKGTSCGQTVLKE